VAAAPLKSFSFELEARSGAARAGSFATPNGCFRTPAFMPVGTHGAVKALTADQVRATSAEIVLANTYHLALRPGEKIIEKLGGLHRFMSWGGPIITDSGGFQVFSLPGVEIDDGGVRFKNAVDGSSMKLTPERSIEIQHALGADIIMAFDDCSPFPADAATLRDGVRRTLAWIDRCLKTHQGFEGEQALFGIVQGGIDLGLRTSCAEALVALDLPGYAIGGVSVGEGHELLCKVTEHTAPLLPNTKPRYLMGVGLPEDLLAAIGYGIDMFDCVIPTRYARSATAFTRRGRIRLTYPIDTSCDCAACAQGYSRAYLHHLFAANEVLSAVLTSIHNVHFYQRIVREARDAIVAGHFDEHRREFLAAYSGEGSSPVETSES